MAAPVTIKESVLTPFVGLIEPPVGGVPGQGKEIKSVQTVFNTKEVLPISVGILMNVAKAWQLLDAPGGEFVVLKCAPAGSVRLRGVVEDVYCRAL